MSEEQERQEEKRVRHTFSALDIPMTRQDKGLIIT